MAMIVKRKTVKEKLEVDEHNYYRIGGHPYHFSAFSDEPRDPTILAPKSENAENLIYGFNRVSYFQCRFMWDIRACEKTVALNRLIVNRYVVKCFMSKPASRE